MATPQRNSGVKTRGKPFAPGNSGRPPGARGKLAALAEKLVVADATEIIEKLIERAKAGDAVCLKLVIDRIWPARKDAPFQVKLPPIASAADIPAALAAITHAVANGELSPAEGVEIARLVEFFMTSITTSQLEERLSVLEANASTAP